jgi:hypothetical protein
VNGARDELLAHAGLALHQDVHQRAFEPMQQGEELPHRGRAADEPAIPVGLATLRQRVQVGRDGDLDLTDADHAAEGQRHLVEALAEIISAIAAAEIASHNPLGRQRELDVPARDCLVVDDQIGVGARAHHTGVGLLGVEPELLIRALDAHDGSYGSGFASR